MDPVALDSCCLINIYSMGDSEKLLKNLGIQFYVPKMVLTESICLRTQSPDGKEIKLPIDLRTAFDDGTLFSCDIENSEAGLFVELAKVLDDGEAMTLAMAKSRGWTVATDDAKARRIAGERQIPITGTPELVKLIAETHSLSAKDLAVCLRKIEYHASYTPGKKHPFCSWWATAKSGLL